MNLKEKEKKLEALLSGMSRTIVAYSGGVDSSYLAYKAHEVLGQHSLAITADSPALPSHQRNLAISIAAQFGFAHEVIKSREMERSEYLENPPNRCYFCKDELFTQLGMLAKERGYRAILDGLNTDDLADYRPGRQAASEHRVRSPLVEAGLNKLEIRELSRQAGLPTADQPASACLASRFPYGVRITEDNLRIVDRGEEALRDMGFRIFRVRHHQELVRLEFGPEDLSRAMNVEIARRLTSIFKGLGYKFVTLDLEGYRMGSLNEVLVTKIG
jgi:uncharacterized protein